MPNSGMIFHRHKNEKLYVYKVSKQRCNLATNIGWKKSTMGIRNFNLRRSPIRKRGKLYSTGP
jgi:hypothetical protein